MHERAYERSEGFPDYYDQRPRLVPLSKLSGWAPKEGSPDIMGWDVFDRNGDKIGAVDDVYIHPDTGEAVFVLIGYGGFLGMGEKSTLVPLDMMETDEDNHRLNYFGTMDDIKSAPEWHRDREEFHGFYDYWKEHHYAGRRPYAGEAPAGAPERGERIAEVEEHLEPYKRVEETGRVEAHKEVETETETIREPVRRTRVHVYRRAITGERDLEPGEEISGEEEVVIPVTEEHLEVRKKAEVTGEVVIRPETYTEEEEVSGEVRKETVHVEEHGDVELEEEETEETRRSRGL